MKQSCLIIVRPPAGPHESHGRSCLWRLRALIDDCAIAMLCVWFVLDYNLPEGQDVAEKLKAVAQRAAHAALSCIPQRRQKSKI